MSQEHAETTRERANRRPHSAGSHAAARRDAVAPATAGLGAQQLAALQRAAGNQAVARFVLAPGRAPGATTSRPPDLPAPSVDAHVRPARQVHRFEASEHRAMGDRGSADAKGRARRIRLSDTLTVTFGDLTAMAGDLFGSVAQIRNLVNNPVKRGPGSIEEVEYALYVKVRGTKTDADFDPKVVNAVTRRYYTLASRNVTHFTNPGSGDAARGFADKASQRDAAGEPVNNAGGYRLNHELAIEEAVRAGATRRPLDDALLFEGFASHFLTDAYSSGHVRTERASISAWWNQRVPMFWHNLKLWMAESIAKALNDDTSVAGPAALTVQMLWEMAQETLNKVVTAKGIPDLTFGDAISGAVHDFDNEKGVTVTIGKKLVELVGDGQVLDDRERDLVAGAGTMAKAVAGVKVSLADVHAAYAKGKAGQTDAAKVKKSLKVAGGLYRAEQLWPRALPDTDKRQRSRSLTWRVATPEDLFRDARMAEALRGFANGKANELKKEINLDPPFKAEKEAAFEKSVLRRLRGDTNTVIKVLREIIGYTPGSVSGELGGVGGHDEDDNALTYYRQAKRTPGGLASLSAGQRTRLIRNVLDGATMGDEERMVLDLLTSTTDATQIRTVIGAVGWRRIYDELPGETCRRFMRYCGPVYWSSASYQQKKAEVAYLAGGYTSETAQEAIVIILRTCSAGEVRRIDDEVGGWTGLTFDLTDQWDTEFRKLKAGAAR